jgi:rubrerythrin
MAYGPTTVEDKKQPIEDCLRYKLEDEERTVRNYREAIKDYSDNKDVVKVLTEIMQDELEHIGALRVLIEKNGNKDEQASIEEGAQEARDLLGKAAKAGGAKNPQAVAKKVGGKY